MKLFGICCSIVMMAGARGLRLSTFDNNECPKAVKFTQLSDPNNPADYADAYDHLYNDKGYHNDPKLSHEGPIVTIAQNMVPIDKRTSITLGCSHGAGVEKLHKLGFSASGVDVAQKAIDMAISLRGDTCGQPPCFKKASLTELPYENNQFHVGLSSDVLEHIAPDDVPKVAAEISRVVQSYLILRIANFQEQSRSGEKAGMISNVHLSVYDTDWWVEHFKPYGWRLYCDYSDPHGEKHQPGNYVFVVLARG